MKRANRSQRLSMEFDRFGDRDRAQQAGAVRSGALLLADAQPLFRGKAVDATLEIEQGVDTPDRAIAAAAERVPPTAGQGHLRL